MTKHERDEPASAHIADITITATEETGGGMWGCNTEAEMDAIATAVNAIIAALETAGITKTV